MTASSDSLGKVLKTEWTEASLALSRDINRQLFTLQGQPFHVNMSPAAVRERRHRQIEMNARLAQVKRGNKPSYRQRQKNARAAKG